MRIRRKIVCGFAGTVGLGLLLSATSAAAQTGAEVFTAKGCVACHGADGKKSLMPTYPKLAGQNAAYLSYALKTYRAQKRQGDQAPLMAGMAGQLSDADIEKVADFLAKVE
jgi:cytochrome c